MAYNTKEKLTAYQRKWYNKNKEKKAEQLRKWRKSNPESDKNSRLKCLFGINLEKYNEMLASQNGVCKLCFKAEQDIHHNSNKVISLAVDHCHSSKKVRGLLCGKCNKALGLIKDSQEWLVRASLYLRGEL